MGKVSLQKETERAIYAGMESLMDLFKVHPEMDKKDIAGVTGQLSGRAFQLGVLFAQEAARRGVEVEVDIYQKERALSIVFDNLNDTITEAEGVSD